MQLASSQLRASRRPKPGAVGLSTPIRMNATRIRLLSASVWPYGGLVASQPCSP